MPTLDLKKDLKALYNPSAKEVSVVDVPAMNFLMIDGAGDPRGSEAFARATEALYSVSYAAKFALKRSDPNLDYTVMPLEGLWWLAGGNNAEYNPEASRDNWRWTLMIMQPEPITAEVIVTAIAATQKKKASPALDHLRFERYDEGCAAQLLHIGPFSAEWPNVQRVHDFITQSGHTMKGEHHEIYLSDQRRTAPEKLRTILRQPFA